MLKFPAIALLFLSLAFLTNCSDHATRSHSTSPLTPFPEKSKDLDNSFVKIAVNQFLQSTDAPIASSYEISRIDLNGDRRRDALVLFKTPYGYWCGMHGCSMLVFKAQEDKFTLLSSIQPVREPVYIIDEKSNGWKNIVVRVSGRWSKSKDVILRFNGKAYPTAPSRLPPYLRFNPFESVRLFQNGSTP